MCYLGASNFNRLKLFEKDFVQNCDRISRSTKFFRRLFAGKMLAGEHTMRPMKRKFSNGFKPRKVFGAELRCDGLKHKIFRESQKMVEGGLGRIPEIMVF